MENEKNLDLQYNSYIIDVKSCMLFSYLLHCVVMTCSKIGIQNMAILSDSIGELTSLNRPYD